jgi:hypothetical protein
MAKKKAIANSRADRDTVHENPSVATRFKKGESGNPGGRPTGSKRSGTYKEMARRFLKAKVVARDGDKRRRITTEEAAFLKLRVEALNGSVPALRDLLQMMEDMSEDEDHATPQTELSAEDREILKRYLERTESEGEEPKE